MYGVNEYNVVLQDVCMFRDVLGGKKERKKARFNNAGLDVNVLNCNILK